MFRKKFTALPVFLLLLSTLAISGCIQLGGEEAPAKYGNGLVITSFESLPSTVFSSDTFDIMLDVQNKGGVAAEDVKAYLYSLSGATNIGTTPLFTTLSSDLDPPTEEFEGEMDTESWGIKAPDLPEGITDTLNPKVRVYYKYKTLGRANLPVLSKSEYKRLRRRDKTLPKLGSTTVSRGPFSVNIKGQSPTLVESTDKSFRIYVIIENLLEGTPYKKSQHPPNEDQLPKGDDLKEINMTLQASGATVTGDCGMYTDGGYVRIRRGESIKKSCELNVTSVKPSQTIPITVTLDYGYFISGETQVTVKGEG